MELGFCMTRTTIPNRRPSVTKSVVFHQGSGNQVKLLVTVGFKDGVPMEVFCADFKAGSEFHALVMDTCILISRLLQHGDSAKVIARSLSHPLVLTLLRTVEEICE